MADTESAAAWRRQVFLRLGVLLLIVLQFVVLVTLMGARQAWTDALAALILPILEALR